MRYVEQIQPTETDSQLVSLRSYAMAHNVPIISRDGIRFLTQIAKLKEVQNVLEIGTAIGYTAIYLARQLGVQVTTIERDLDMIELAQQHIKDSGLASQIRLIQDDAILVDPNTLGRFDLIFIDAAKAQSINLFQKYKTRLQPHGVIVTDNLFFHDLHGKDNLSRPLARMVEKIDAFNRFVLEQPDFDTTIHAIGDGMSVSIRKE